MKFSKNSVLRLGLSITALAAIASSCSGNQASRQKKIATELNADKLAKAGKAAEAADEYARIGELLLTPEGVNYADQMFDKALSIDSTNAKANLYSAAVKPVMAFRGFVPRFEKAFPTYAREFANARLDIVNTRLPEVIKFVNELPAGAKAATSYHDVQRFLRTELLPQLVAASQKLGRVKANQPIEINVNLARLGLGDSEDGMQSSYDSYSYDSGCYQNNGRWECHYYNSSSWISVLNPFKGARRFVDSSDIKAIQTVVMAATDYVRLNTAYSVEGIEGVLQRVETADLRGRPLSTAEVIKIIKNTKGLGVLEHDHQLAELRASSEQALRNLMEFRSMKNALCYSEARNGTNSLFTNLCVSDDAGYMLTLGVDLLAGPTEVPFGVNVKFAQNGQYDEEEVTILMNLARVLNDPPKDLKTLLPSQVAANGKPVTFPDLTMGGLFPNGDLIKKIETTEYIYRWNIPSWLD